MTFKEKPIKHGDKMCASCGSYQWSNIDPKAVLCGGCEEVHKSLADARRSPYPPPMNQVLDVDLFPVTV